MTAVQPALTETELQELESLLEALPNAGCVEEVDGLMCALVIHPGALSFDEWLPLIIGEGDEDDENPLEQAQIDRLHALLTKHWAHVAGGFREDWSGMSAEEGSAAMYFPQLERPEDSGHPLAEGWARGFRDGLNLLENLHWDALELDQKCVSALNLIAAFDYGELAPGVPLTADKREAAISEVAADVQYLNLFWRRWLRVKQIPRVPLRADAAPGRNDTCPCGSGVKFKKCCGSPEKLH